MADVTSIASQQDIKPVEKRQARSVHSEKSAQGQLHSHSPPAEVQHVERCCALEKKDLETGRCLTCSSERSSLDARVAPKPRARKSTDNRLRGRAQKLYAWPWWWEMWACVGSVTSFLAMTGLLFAFDGKAQPDWPYGATLNSADGRRSPQLCHWQTSESPDEFTTDAGVAAACCGVPCGCC